MAFIVAIALAVRLFGIGTGLPDDDRAQPLNIDEWTPLKTFQSMNPRQLDFNPHYFDNPTFYYYQVAALIGVGAATGWINIRGDERFYFAHPEHVARMVVLGRLLAMLFGVGTVVLMYPLARRVGLGRGWSTVAMLLLAVHPSHVVHSHYMAVNTAVAFWAMLAMLLLDRWVRRGGGRAAAAAGIAAGFALSTKYTGILLIALIPVAWVARAVRRDGPSGTPRRILPEALWIPAALVLAFVAGSPYVLLGLNEFVSRFTGWANHYAEPGARIAIGTRISEFLSQVVTVNSATSTPPLLVAGFLGAWPALRRPSFLRVAFVVWLACMMVGAWFAGALATDGRYLPLFPPLVLLAVILLASWDRRAPVVARACATLVALTMAAWTIVLLARFTDPQPQDLASEWALRSIRSGERVLLTGAAEYYQPDLLVREYRQARNRGAYERRTDWVFVSPDTFPMPYARARLEDPDVVVLASWLPRRRAEMQWLSDPGYRVVAHFPGRLQLFGRRIHVPLDIYDVDIWALRPVGSRTTGSGAGDDGARPPEPGR